MTMTKSKLGLQVLVAFLAWLWVRPCRLATDPAVTVGSDAPTSVSRGHPRNSAAITRGEPTRRGTRPCVLSGKSPFDRDSRSQLESVGVRVVAFLSRTSLLVEADAEAAARLAADGRFRDLTELVPSQKLQPALSRAMSTDIESVEVSIITLADEDRPTVVSRIERGGGLLLTGCINERDVIRARLSPSLVAELASCAEVRWLERFDRPCLMNDCAVDAKCMNVRDRVWNAHGLTGIGQKISTSDSGIDTGKTNTMHADLRNRVKAIMVADDCFQEDFRGHGTHTAGSIVGDGTMSDGNIKGVAYGAELYAWFCCDMNGKIRTPSELNQLYRNDDKWNTYIHSASWGDTCGGAYVETCRNHDRYVWEHPEFLPVFAVGNRGSMGAGTIEAPAAGKNVLAVGATKSSRPDHDMGGGNGDPSQTPEFSGRGPCLDGRTKPDVAAPGEGVLSTCRQGAGGDAYAYMSGTSMACPLAAGAVALIRQGLVERWGFADEDGLRPTAALMKAVIMGGAKGASVPNDDQGWGRIDVGETLFPSNRAVRFVDRIPFAQGFSTNIVIETTATAPLDVQLVWVDYPGDPSAEQGSSKLVNDLDLTVQAFDGEKPVVHYGNGGQSPDRLNNAESVRIANAKPGTYVITVSCPGVLYSHADGGAAALYVRGGFAQPLPGSESNPWEVGIGALAYTNGTGRLTIEGVGKVDSAPWAKVAASISELQIGSGVSDLGNTLATLPVITGINGLPLKLFNDTAVGLAEVAGISAIAVDPASRRAMLKLAVKTASSLDTPASNWTTTATSDVGIDAPGPTGYYLVVPAK